MATTFDKASLALIPSGIKDGKVYSIKPTDGSGDFTFSRGTGTATRVNSSGLIEKERSNYLLYSNTFDNAAWTLKRTGSNPLPSVTSGFSDPDGGTSAYRFQVTAPSADNDYSVISQTPSFSGVSGTPFVQSIYVKANGAGQIGKFFDVYAYQPSSSSYRSVENFELTGDWQRVELFHTFNASGSTMEIVFGKARSSAGGSTLSNMATDVLIYSSQLEFGLAASSPVIKTTSSVVYEGITDNLPRLDYSGGASCPSLLLEPSRTNVFSNSEYFNDSSTWTQNANIQIDDNQDTSPDGSVNASRIYNNTGSDTTIFYGASVNVGSAGTYIFSTFAKKGGLSWLRLRCLGFDAGANNNCYFDLENGVKGTNTFDNADIEDYGNGWYRIWAEFTTTTDLTGTCYVYGADGDNDVTIPSGASNYISVWGAQLEAGYLTSYIPTYGASASRAADDCELNDTTGVLPTGYPFTMYAEINLTNTETQQFYSFLHKGLSNAYYSFEYNNGYLYANMRPNGVSNAFSYTGITQDVGKHKIAVTITDSVAKLFVDGQLLDTITSVPTFNSAIDDLFVGKLRNVSDTGNRTSFNQALMFDSALTDAEAIALTTL